MNYVAVDVGEPKIAAAIAVGEPLELISTNRTPDSASRRAASGVRPCEGIRLRIVALLTDWPSQPSRVAWNVLGKNALP